MYQTFSVRIFVCIPRFTRYTLFGRSMKWNLNKGDVLTLPEHCIGLKFFGGLLLNFEPYFKQPYYKT